MENKQGDFYLHHTSSQRWQTVGAVIMSGGNQRKWISLLWALFRRFFPILLVVVLRPKRRRRIQMKWEFVQTCKFIYLLHSCFFIQITELKQQLVVTGPS